MKNSKGNLRLIIGNLDFALAAAILMALVVLTVYGVFMRYIVNAPLTWLEEVQVACMVWIVFTGAGAAFRAGSVVSIELFVEMLPRKIQAVISLMVSILVFAILAYLLYQSIGFVKLFERSGRSTSILKIPFTLIYGVAPFSYGLMIFCYFYVKYFKPQEEEAQND